MTNVCFIGHSKVEDIEMLKNKMKIVIRELIENGAKNFYFGGRGMFDFICWEVTDALQKEFTFIKKIYCYECSSHSRKKPRWLNLEDYDQFELLDFYDKTPKAIYFRNCAMIDKCDQCIFYVEKRSGSGAYKAFEYAQKHKQNYINVF